MEQIQNKHNCFQNQDLPLSIWMATSVQCVPGGHQISINDAYWCGQCQYYLCYSHAQTSFWVNTIKCPKGHEVTKAA
jgi:hypothetical protein